MGLFANLSKFNLVAVICMITSIVCAGLIVLSMFLPWAENRESATSMGTCNAIFPPLFDHLIEPSCQKTINSDGKEEKVTNKWTDSLYQGTNYVVSALLFVTLIIISFSFFRNKKRANRLFLNDWL